MAANPFNANQTEVYYKPEKTSGINHTHGIWNRLRIRSESLSQSKTTFSTRNFKRARNTQCLQFSEDAPAGNITCLLTAQDADELFQSVLRNRWNANQLNQGEVNRTYSILVINEDSSGNKHHTMYLGCVFSSCNFNFQINSYVTFSFNVTGTKVINDYQPDSNIDLAKISDNDTFIGRDAVIRMNGRQVGLISAFTGSFGHTVEALKSINLANPFRLRFGSFDTNCSLSAAFANSTNILDYVNDTSFELSIRLEYKLNIYTFTFPRCFMGNISFPSSGEGAIVITTDVLPIFSENRGSTVILKKERTTP